MIEKVTRKENYEEIAFFVIYLHHESAFSKICLEMRYQGQDHVHQYLLETLSEYRKENKSIKEIHQKVYYQDCYDMFLYTVHTLVVHPGKNVGIGNDHTIFSLIDGLVKFEKFGPDKAKVEGQKITWLTPHVLQQLMPQDVDFKIMLTFLVFYELINLKYPHILDPRLKPLVADLYALTRYVGARYRTNGTNDEESKLRLQDQLPSNESGALMNLVVNTTFMSENDEETRVPRESLLFVITTFGGVVSWEGDGALFEESNQDINYQVLKAVNNARERSV
ncbi:pescadillo [Tanacetum coccineum]